MPITTRVDQTIPQPTTHIDAQAIQAWTTALLRGAGLGQADAGRAATIFYRASRRDLGHHDISYLPRRLDWLVNQGVNPRPALARVGGGPAAEVWDGDHGLGEVCCSHITYRSIELAQKFGIGLATIRASNHFLAAAPYAEIGAESGCLVVVFSNTDAGMSAPDGTRPIIGNNPLGFGMRLEPPVPGRAAQGPGLTDFIFDSCLAYSSLGNLAVQAEAGTSVPFHWGNDSQGRPSHDPAAILEGGAVHPIGGHKGFGLGLLVELLTGVLAGGASGDQIPAGGGLNAHTQTVIAFDLARFEGARTEDPGHLAGASRRAADLANRLKAAEPGLRLPGERSAQARAQTEAEGVVLRHPVLQELRDWSVRLGVTPPTDLPR